MEEEKIKFDTAILAKEKGFHIRSNQCYYPHENIFETHNRAYNSSHVWDTNFIESSSCWKDEYYYAPTQSLLHTWIRENHGIYILVIPTITASWTFKSIRVISKIDEDVIKGLKSVSDLPPYKDVHGYDYSTYEAALEAGLVAALNEI